MTLKETAETLVREHLADFVYAIRDRAATADMGYGGNAWKLPRVKAFSDACVEVRRLVEPIPRVAVTLSHESQPGKAVTVCETRAEILDAVETMLGPLRVATGQDTSGIRLTIEPVRLVETS